MWARGVLCLIPIWPHDEAVFPDRKISTSGFEHTLTRGKEGDGLSPSMSGLIAWEPSVRSDYLVWTVTVYRSMRCGVKTEFSIASLIHKGHLYVGL